MLLIIGDALEALFFLVFPIRYLVTGPINSRSAFCQVSGFFLALGIESSDIAVALIAIHTALYIFKPNQGSGQSGLYPYRYWAYAAFVVIPLILAGLAFLNNPAYTNNGSYCYLPADPRWPRFALSWIPRYIILLLILVIYGCIYIYVTILMRRFGEQSDMREPSTAGAAGTGLRTNQTGSVPPTPPIAYHGLIPSSSDSRPASYVDWERHRRGSVSSTGSIGFDPDSGYAPSGPQGAQPTRRQSFARALRWRWPKPTAEADPDAQTDGQRRQSEPVEPALSTAPTSPRQSVVHEPIALPPPSVRADEAGRGPVVKRARPSNPTSQMAQHQRAMSVPYPLSSEETAVSGTPQGRNSQPDPGFWNRPVDVGDKSSNNTTTSNPNMVAVLHRGPPRRKRGQRMSEPVDPNDPNPNPQPNVSGGSTGTSSSNFVPPHMSADPAGMGKARDKIRRQLRLLFIYPVIYVLVWVIPFISHIFRWDDPNKSGPFALVYTSLISLCIQGFADAVLFGMREKPWRHPRRASVSSTGSIFRRRSSNEARTGFRTMITRCFGDKWEFRQNNAGGRTREEMLLDGRFARIRRELEHEEFMTRPTGPRTEREWWEWLENIGGSWDEEEEAGAREVEDFELESPGRKRSEAAGTSRVAFKEEDDYITDQH